MVDKPTNTNRFARNPQSGMAAATALGMNALRPIMKFQISMLRMWADSIERLASNYDRGLEEAATSAEQPEERPDQERAA
ncbi:hypothetical protein [Bradyrhizobium sp. CCBAU 51627]|uniref:hypothetical protein n=1 Tax=Bradyrhizobium sp. CCBAU 51627 TaxID=1325088 RepID=UPI0023060E19|nr:hypothetical protein [Bradyrhizobium sp. CCBAU 51627]MDA9431919.1 hypothetical protein [Bradyrhizobium sp. CCBAU 51627]